MFPRRCGAVQIVDPFYAKERLRSVAKAVYGADGDLGKRWARQRLDERGGGRLDDLLAALGVQAASSEEARKCLDYVRQNRRRMRYPQFQPRRQRWNRSVHINPLSAIDTSRILAATMWSTRRTSTSSSTARSRLVSSTSHGLGSVSPDG